MPSDSLKPLQKVLGYSFRKSDLLREALTHKSFLNELTPLERKESRRNNNERLEFLGDAVLDLAISEYLIRKFPESAEGDLSKRKARVVSEAALARVALGLDLGGNLFLGKGEEQTGGREKPSLLADALEAVIAAVYLDGGYPEARETVVNLFREEISRLDENDAEKDYKTEAQELCQKNFSTLPVYQVIRETGPDHQKMFEVNLLIRRRSFGKGRGRTKKEAEQRAAQETLKKLKKT